MEGIYDLLQITADFNLTNPLIAAVALAVIVTAIRMTGAIKDGRYVQLYILAGTAVVGAAMVAMEFFTRGELNLATGFYAVKLGVFFVAPLATFGAELVKNVGGLLGIGGRAAR